MKYVLCVALLLLTATTCNANDYLAIPSDVDVNLLVGDFKVIPYVAKKPAPSKVIPYTKTKSTQAIFTGRFGFRRFRSCSNGNCR